MKKSLFVALVLSASISALFFIFPLVSRLFPGDIQVVDIGFATIDSARILGSSIFFTAVFVLSILGIYKEIQK